MPQGGKSHNDRVLAADVRTITLNKIKKLFEIPKAELSDNESKLHDAVLIKLAGTVLPRLNEHTGEDGGAIIIKGNSIEVKKYNGDSSKTDS